MKIIKFSQCSGCGACFAICPTKSIEMQYNENGFLVPKIKDSCIQCGLCKKICPGLTPVKAMSIAKVYKASHKGITSKENQKSSSGAMFPLFAGKIMKEEGVVAGVRFCEGYYNVEHTICNSVEEMDACRGSKYIQSNASLVYRQVKENLDGGKKVLFSGTPCQMAGLKAFLRKDYENLYTVDFICHGVGSTKYYQEFLKYIAKGENIEYVNFRSKEHGFDKSCLKVVVNGKVKVDAPYYREESLFGKAFANNLIARESCGTCKYASVQRVADITVADNIIDNNEKEAKWGSSFVFINTDKGAELFDEVKPNLECEEKDATEIVSKMMHLNAPAKPHKDRNKVLALLKKKGFVEAQKYVTPYQAKRINLCKRIAIKLRLRLNKKK